MTLREAKEALRKALVDADGEYERAYYNLPPGFTVDDLNRIHDQVRARCAKALADYEAATTTRTGE